MNVNVGVVSYECLQREDGRAAKQSRFDDIFHCMHQRARLSVYIVIRSFVFVTF